MRRIFIGSSKEGLRQAEQVAALLTEVNDVQPLLWTQAFRVGEVTSNAIDEVAEKVAGAVFLATPDGHPRNRDTSRAQKSAFCFK